MAWVRPAGDRQARLDPVRWPGAPRRATVGRLGMVAALLVAAASLLYVRTPEVHCPAAGAPTHPPAAASPGRSPGWPGTVPGTVGGSEQPRLAVPTGTVGVVVTLAEPAALAVLRAGDRVDLVGTAPARSPATLAANVLVLATPDVTGGGLYLALGPGPARAIMALPPGTSFAVLVRS